MDARVSTVRILSSEFLTRQWGRKTQVKLTEAPVLEVDRCSEVGRPPYAIALSERRVRHIQELLWQSAEGVGVTRMRRSGVRGTAMWSAIASIAASHVTITT